MKCCWDWGDGDCDKEGPVMIGVLEPRSYCVEHAHKIVGMQKDFLLEQCQRDIRNLYQMLEQAIAAAEGK